MEEPMLFRAAPARWLVGILALLLLGTSEVGAQTVIDPCAKYPTGSTHDAYIADLIAKFGYADFHEPPVVRPTDANAPYELVVQYSKGQKIAGCAVELRSYNGQLVGATLRARPGDTLYIRLTNRLPDVPATHPQAPLPNVHPHPFSFNITNLHTHGLNTSPRDDGDNVLLEVHPEKYPGDQKGTQLYRIHIHDKHPTGTFWYHAHYHGSTAMQVSSGMAGALIIEGGQDANGGLDAVPEIQAAEQKIFVLQQIHFDQDGKLENFAEQILGLDWVRNVTVNGVLVPTIRMRPGEVQRWHFIHAGVQDNINLSLQGHRLYEIEADGLALGRRVDWPADRPSTEEVRSLVLGPGYRTDVLVKAAPLPGGQTSMEYFLYDDELPPALSLQTANARRALARSPALAADPAIAAAAIAGKPKQTIARIIVAGPPKDMPLPTSASLRDRVPSDLAPIKDSELDNDQAQSVALEGDTDRSCDEQGLCGPCKPDQPCVSRFTVNDRVYTDDRLPRTLKLGTASQWTLKGEGGFSHPFHIHVNPFEVERREPGADGQMTTVKVWKDTINVPLDGSPIVIRSRYLRFEGEFVLHCHILDHEDRGMMQRVRISK
jgi:FtsP/CotA-like multicopper oxidase with cupredoxin domain